MGVALSVGEHWSCPAPVSISAQAGLCLQPVTQHRSCESTLLTNLIGPQQQVLCWFLPTPAIGHKWEEKSHRALSESDSTWVPELKVMLGQHGSQGRKHSP